MLENDFNFVIDADTEIFVWSGSFSSIQERKLAHLLAGCLATQPGRPKDVFITRVLQNSEMMIFKEKFGDYPGMLPVNVTPMNEGNENYVKMEQPEIDIPALQAPKFAAEEDIDDGKGTIDAMWIIRKRKKAFGDNYEFDKELLNEKEYGTFYSGERYTLLLHLKVLRPVIATSSGTNTPLNRRKSTWSTFGRGATRPSPRRVHLRLKPSTCRTRSVATQPRFVLSRARSHATLFSYSEA